MSKTVTFKCLYCGEEHTSPNKYACNAKYCSQKCQMDYRSMNIINNWLSGGKIPGSKAIKNYIAQINGNKCSVCGISDWMGIAISLELEHIDGNSENNNINNLSLICPNCHSQTSTYKGKNKGNGRHKRKLRYQNNQSY